MLPPRAPEKAGIKAVSYWHFQRLAPTRTATRQHLLTSKLRLQAAPENFPVQTIVRHVAFIFISNTFLRCGPGYSLI